LIRGLIKSVKFPCTATVRHHRHGKQRLGGVWKDKWSSWLHSESFPLRTPK